MSDDDAVYGRGPIPARWMIVGQSPGPQEIEAGLPFVGPSGDEQRWYLSRHGLREDDFYLTNVVKTYVKPKERPHPDEVARWTPYLVDEIAQVRPQLIIAVGAYAMRWLLGAKANLTTCHGMAHRAGAFDPERESRAPEALVVSTFHPAAALYDNDIRALCDYDYRRAAKYIKVLRRGGEVPLRRDPYEGTEDYRDVGGRELADLLGGGAVAISIDTEGSLADPWSLQVSIEHGTGLCLRTARPDFQLGIAALSRFALPSAATTFVIHNAMYDVGMCRAMGLDLSRARIWDSMYAAFLLRFEPQGLKALAWRQLAMRMGSYRDAVAAPTAGKQTAYLLRVLEGSLRGDWPGPVERLEYESDGTRKVYSPEPLYKSVVRALRDYWAGADDDDAAGGDEEGGGGSGDEESGGGSTAAGGVDLAKRWANWDGVQRRAAERVLGPLPFGTLADIPLADAVHYSARDADAALRLYPLLSAELARLDLTRTMLDGMDVLPVFEEVQAQGMPVSRSRLQALGAKVEADMRRVVRELRDYNDGRPFNPNSSPQVRALMRKRGLEGTKRTKKERLVSTSEKSIGHLRYKDPAIERVFVSRELSKMKGTFIDPTLRRTHAEVEDIVVVRGQVKMSRVATRRIAMSDPNLLQIPIRGDLAKELRACYVAPPGYVLGSWDLSQVELRAAAHITRDPLLCQLLRDGRDVYAETAARLFEVPVEDVDHDTQRDPAKRITLGTLYGLQGEGLLTQLQVEGITGYSLDDCNRVQAGWFEIYSGVRRYIDEELTVRLERDGYVRDMWGMYRYLPGIWSDDRKVRAESLRIALSHEVSGGAQGMIQRSMPWIWRKERALRAAGVDVWSRLQFHDELVLSMPDDEGVVETVGALVLEGLTEHCGLRLRVPVVAKGKVGRSWAELK